MSDANRETLLYLLREYAPGNVYSIAPKKYVLNGMDYCRSGRLSGFEWNADSSVMSAKVKGNGLYSVDISAGNGRLSFECDCPAWSHYDNCKHVVCALLAIKDLTSASHPRFIPSHDGYRDRLTDELRGEGQIQVREADENNDAENGKDEQTNEEGSPQLPESAQDKFEIVLSVADGEITDILVRTGGRRVTWENFSGVPADLRRFLPSSYSIKPKLSEFGRYVDGLCREYPIIMKTAAGEMEIRFDASAEYTAATGMDACADGVKVQRLFLKEDVRRKGLMPCGPFVIDAEGSTFSLIGETTGWTAWMEFREAFFRTPAGGESAGTDEHELTVPVETLNDCALCFPSEEGDRPKDLRLMAGGIEADPVKSEPSYRVTISPSGDGLFVLRPEVVLEGETTSAFLPLFLFFKKLETEVPLQLRANKRRDLMIRAFFDMLSAGTKAASEKIVREAVQDMELNSYKMKRTARTFLSDHLAMFNLRLIRLLLRDLKWLSAPVDQEAEAFLYKIPYELFGWEIFRGVHHRDGMKVRAADLIRSLPDLYERLKKSGVSLFFDGEPLSVSSWEFSFDVGRKTGIDWFEIRPEIRCDGELVSDDAFMQMLKGGGTINKRGCLRIMDSNSQKVFSMLSAIYGAGDGPEGNGKKIVKVPRLRILDWIMLRNLGAKVNLPPEDEEIVGRLTCFEKIEQRPLPACLNARLRKYQKDGYCWLAFLYENRFGACLADDMGLGKTIQAISLLAGIREGKIVSPLREGEHPHLVVLPPSLLFNWESEIRRFCPDLKMFFYTGRERATSFEGFDVVLTTYGLVRRDSERLKNIVFDVIIFDEAQAVKNIHADTTGAVRRLKANFKLAMTGTPLENHVGEYYSIADLVLPGLLGEYEKIKPLIRMETSPALDLIIGRTRPFVLRRTKEMILKELPPKVETDIYLDLTDKQKALYRRTVEEIKTAVDRAYKTKTTAQAGIIALTAILKLRQICIAPRLVAPGMTEPSPKAEFLVDRLKELLDEGHSALVFSQFTTFLDILGEDLRRHSMSFVRLDGSTQVKRRKKIVGEFQSGGGPSVFLLSLKAGGQGLNLTRASYVFHLDPWWNPAVENQASDRAHRIGQKKKVTVTRLLMRHTIEEKMMALKSRKREIFRAVMEGAVSGKKGLSITKEDFDYLLG